MDITDPVVRFWGDIWSDGDITALDEVFAEGATENGEIIDVEAFKQGVEGFRRIFENWKVTVEEMLVLDDRVITRVTYTGKHVRPLWGIPPSGVEVRTPGLDIFRVRDGKIVELWHSVDHLDFAMALGGTLVPKTDHAH